MPLRPLTKTHAPHWTVSPKYWLFERLAKLADFLAATFAVKTIFSVSVNGEKALIKNPPRFLVDFRRCAGSVCLGGHDYFYLLLSRISISKYDFFAFLA
jgi:hypothetical protein